MKNLLAAVAVMILCGATVAHAQHAQEVYPKLPPPLAEGEQDISPAGAAEAQPHVQALQEQAAQAVADAEAKVPDAPKFSPIASAIAALKTRVTDLEAANKELTAARRGVRVKWKVVTKAISPFHAELCTLNEALQNLRVDVASTKAGLKKVAMVAGEARQRAKLAQASAAEANDGVSSLRGRLSHVENTADAALRLASAPPPPKTVFATASAFTGWSSEAIVGLGIGLQAPFAKLDARVSTNIGDYREVDALIALRTSTSATWFNPYGGLHVVGVFKNGVGNGITDNRVGPGVGNGIKIAPASAIDIRFSVDKGGESTVVAVTAGYQHSF